MKWMFPLSVLILVLVLAPGCISTPVAPNATPTVSPTFTLPPATAISTVLHRLTLEVNTTLQELDRAAAESATQLGSTGLTGPAANETLAQLANSSPYAVDAVAISADGFIVAVMPPRYQGAIGVYVGNESHNEKALQERIPLMTPVFPAAEGFDAVSIRYPVWSPSGEFLGLSTVLVNPSWLLAAQANQTLAGTNFSAWAIQTDGLLIYDSDPGDLVGRNLITDPIFADFPDLVSLARRIAAERSGNGTYIFTPTIGGPAVRKEAVWDTVGLHGTEWRLLVAQEI